MLQPMKLTNNKQVVTIMDLNRFKNKKTWIVLLILAGAYALAYNFNLGYIQYGDTSITFLHIPVILVTLFLGLPEGLLAAAFFGVSSMMTAAQVDHLFTNPLVSVLPRLMIPVVVWFVSKTLSKKIDDNTYTANFICNFFPALCGIFSNTIFVVLSLAVLYPEKIGTGDRFSALTTIMSSLLAGNVRYEIILVLLFTVFMDVIYIILKKKVWSTENRPIQKTFQKWLFLISMVTFFVTFRFLFALLSYLNLSGYMKLVQEKAHGVARLVVISEEYLSGDDIYFGEYGYTLIIENNKVIASGNKELEGKEFHLNKNEDEEKTDFEQVVELTLGDLYGTEGLYAGEYANEKIVVAFMPTNEIYIMRNKMLTLLLIGLLILFMILYFVITYLVRNRVVKKIEQINDSLTKIRGGNLNEVVNVSGNTEFEELSQGINDTVDALKNTMKEIEEKNQQEMEFAREIQISALPNPDCFGNQDKDISVWGTMDTAEDVGGDFFDLYLLEDGRLGVVIADVSGKGVPAAMFMMTAKTMLKDMILSGKSPADVLRVANAELAKNNDYGMFVTAWLGVLDYRKGTLVFANAGHNPPLLKKKDSDPVYMDYKRYKRSLMLAFMPDTEYENNEIAFEPDDMLFLYTDGITEARNSEKDFYGEDRLMDCMIKHSNEDVHVLLNSVRADVEAFVGDAEQFDDMTMLAIKRQRKNQIPPL